MDHTDLQLEKMSQDELAHLLATSPRYSDQWWRVRAECEKRMQRWGVVAHYAGWAILAVLFVAAVASLTGGA